MMTRTHRSACRYGLAALAAGFVLIAATGCIRSMVRITSTPSEARVTINNYERGRTPIEVPILWYWWYRIRLEKDGYEPKQVDERFYAPPWAHPPIDLFFEIVPVPIRNTYNRHYELEPSLRPR